MLRKVNPRCQCQNSKRINNQLVLVQKLNKFQHHQHNKTIQKLKKQIKNKSILLNNKLIIKIQIKFRLLHKIKIDDN